MSKSVGKLIAIAGIVFLSYATFGVATLMAAGTATTVTGALGASGWLGLTLGQMATIGLGALSIGSTASASIEQTESDLRGQATFDLGAMGAYVFGTTTVPLNLVYEEVFGEGVNQIVNDVYAHAWHKIEGYTALFVGTNDGTEEVTFTGASTSPDAPFAGALFWVRAEGDQTNSLSADFVEFSNNTWPIDAVFKGVAHSGFVWVPSHEDFQAKFSAVPNRFDVVAEAAMLYDPRLDPAYGSGTQDYATPSTWTFNNGNAALVLLRYLIGEYAADGRLIWGRGALETDIDMDSFIAAANVADETLDGIPRYRLGGFHALDGDWEAFARRWEDETGGKLRKDAAYRVWLPNDDLTPLTAITENDLLAGTQIGHQIGRGVDTLFNCARGRYIEPTEGYRPKVYADINEPTAIDEDGSRRVLSQDFSWVQDLSIAQRIARYKIRRSRFQRLWTVPMGWKGQHPNYRPFTVHTLNCEETGGEDQTVRIVDRRRSFGGATVLLVQQEDASIYDDTLPLNDPLASDEIPTRIDRLGTYTARTINIAPGAATAIYQSFAAGPFNMSTTSTIPIGFAVTTYAPPAQSVDCTLQVTVEYETELGSIAGAQDSYLGDGATNSHLLSVRGNSTEPARQAISYQFAYTADASVTLSLGWSVTPVGSPASNTAIYRNVKWIVEFIKR